MSETTVRFYIGAGEPSVFRLREENSIETEPRTLNEGELHSAREAAVDIIQKKEPEEARTIFTKGLRPVRSVKEMESLLKNRGQAYYVMHKSQGDRLQSSSSLSTAPRCQCECGPNNNNHNKRKAGIDGPSSAPF